MSDSGADRVEVLAGLGYYGPQGGPPFDVTVTASVGGGPETIAHVRYQGGDTSAPILSLDPCQLMGGSDLPGTTVTFSFAGGPPNVEGAPLQVRLGEDDAAPDVALNSSPPNGKKVKAGDQIKIDALAREKRSGGPWQMGVQSIEVRANGDLVKDESYLSFRGKKCGAKSWTQALPTATYTVPSNPPDPVTICAIAEDFAGNQREKCAKFPTKERWTGVIRSRLDAPTCLLVEEGRVRLSVDGKTVTGSGTIRVTRRGRGCTGPDEATLAYSATKTSDAFRLVQTDNFGGRAVFVAPIAGRSARAGFPPISYLTGTLTLQCATCPA